MGLKRIGGTLVSAAVAALALGIAAANAQDQPAEESKDKWYQVELIVFERLTETSLESETWDNDPGMPSVEESIALTRPGESPLEGPGPHAFRILPPDQQQLAGTYGHLENAADLEPILHLAWRQPGLPKEDAPWIQIYLPPREGEIAPSPEPVQQPLFGGGIGRQDESDIGGFDPYAAGAAAEPEPPAPVLDGVFRLYLSRYLHAGVDLVYHREGVEIPFRLKTSRRMRSNELHYLDHPVFGVLVKVTPYEVEKSE